MVVLDSRTTCLGDELLVEPLACEEALCRGNEVDGALDEEEDAGGYVAALLVGGDGLGHESVAD